MLKKLAAAFALAAFITAANGNVLANGNATETNKAKTETRKPLKGITYTTSSDVKREKSTLAEHQKTNKQHKRFSTTTKVLIGAGIAAAVVGVVVVLAKKDLERNIWR